MVESERQAGAHPKGRARLVEYHLPAGHKVAIRCGDGRNPQTASVLISTGLLDKLNRNEILGVLAHEIAHIRARDTLTTTITATLAGAIASFGVLGLLIDAATAKRGGLFAVILSVFTILAAGLLQIAVSRSREYAADEAGAGICGLLALLSPRRAFPDHRERAPKGGVGVKRSGGVVHVGQHGAAQCFGAADA